MTNYIIFYLLFSYTFMLFLWIFEQVQDHCPMMEVGLLIRVPDSPGAAPDQAGQYQIPVSIKGGTYQALVDSGCN